MEKSQEKFKLEDRTAKFSGEIIEFIRKINKDIVTIPLLNQLVRSATSIGANYCEANGASSKKDFKNKIYICKKEAKETKYWLQLLGKASVENIEECRKFWQEAHELTLIFSKIIVTMEGRNKEIKNLEN
ncbi:MAG: four helix bundle protein [Candidatus Moranbacteria bacterium]|nr:four helix bundle protein [Candidatus Moranbacteria bacterium]